MASLSGRTVVVFGGSSGIGAEICRRLEGIPLAIELAAERVSILPVRELATKLDQRFSIPN